MLNTTSQAPVAVTSSQGSEKIAMTAPVSVQQQEEQGKRSMTM